MKAQFKFRAYWSKRENDLMFHYPLGMQTKSDAHWLSGILTKDFQAELIRRGYDFSTFKLEICPQKGNDRFASERKPPMGC